MMPKPTAAVSLILFLVASSSSLAPCCCCAVSLQRTFMSERPKGTKKNLSMTCGQKRKCDALSCFGFNLGNPSNKFYYPPGDHSDNGENNESASRDAFPASLRLIFESILPAGSSHPIKCLFSSFFLPPEGGAPALGPTPTGMPTSHATRHPPSFPMMMMMIVMMIEERFDDRKIHGSNGSSGAVEEDRAGPTFNYSGGTGTRRRASPTWIRASDHAEASPARLCTQQQQHHADPPENCEASEDNPAFQGFLPSSQMCPSLPVASMATGRRGSMSKEDSCVIKSHCRTAVMRQLVVRAKHDSASPPPPPPRHLSSLRQNDHHDFSVSAWKPRRKSVHWKTMTSWCAFFCNFWMRILVAAVVAASCVGLFVPLCHFLIKKTSSTCIYSCLRRSLEVLQSPCIVDPPSFFHSLTSFLPHGELKAKNKMSRSSFLTRNQLTTKAENECSSQGPPSSCSFRESSCPLKGDEVLEHSYIPMDKGRFPSKKITIGGTVTNIRRRAMKTRRARGNMKATIILFSSSCLSCLFMTIPTMVVIVQALNITGPFTIDSTVTWTSMDSPISITGVVDIQADGVLTVLAGTHIVFQSEESGIVNSRGTLNILGNLNNRVLLESSNNSSFWRGISFKRLAFGAQFVTPAEAGSDVVEFTAGSYIGYTDIVRAGTRGTGSSALDFKEGSAPYLLGVSLVDCNPSWGFPVFVDSLATYFVARQVQIAKSAVDSTFRLVGGLHLGGASGTYAVVILENVNIRVTSGHAARLHTVYRASFKNCHLFGTVDIWSVEQLLFSQNVVHFDSPISFDVFRARLYRARTIEGSNSVISDNHFIGGRVYVYAVTNFFRNSTIISNNHLEGSKYGAIYVRSDERNFVLFNNTVENSVAISSNNPTVQLLMRASSFEVLGNTIRNCVANRLLHLQGDSNYVSASWVSQENIVMDSIANEAMLFLAEYPLTSFQKNIFINVTAPTSVQLSLRDGLFAADYRVPLPLNYWGTFQEDVMGLRKTVHDAFKTSKLGWIDFESVLSTPSLESAVDTVQIPQLFLSDGSIGGLLSNGTFELPTSDYECSLAIIVSTNATLMLSKGTNIAFATGRGIVVSAEGRIKMDSTSLLPITLRPTNNSIWSGLSIDSKDPTSIAHVTIEGATKGIQHTGPGDLDLRSIEVREIEDQCIISSSGSPESNIMVADSILVDCGERSLYARQKSLVSISNVTVLRGGGIRCQSRVRNFVMTDSVVVETTDYAVRYWNSASFHSPDSIEVSNSSFRGTNGGIYLYCARYCTANVQQNEFLGDKTTSLSRHVVYLDLRYSFWSIFANNRIEGWNSRYAAVTFAYIAATTDRPGGLELAGNVFRDITASNIVHLAYHSTSRDNVTNIQGIFADNLLASSQSNPALVLIQKWPQAVGSTMSSTFTGNIFMTTLRNDTEQYYVKVLQNKESVATIDASRCYWNTDDVGTLLNRIYDGSDDFGVSTLEYNPILLTTDPNGPIKNATSPFLRDGNFLVGRLEQGQNVTLSKGNYTASGGLVIDGNLMIEPGVMIMLGGGAVVSVGIGQVLAVGTTEDPISFTRLGEDNWGQIAISSSAKPVEIVNVHFSHAGWGGVPVLDMQRSGAFQNVTIRDCFGGSLRVDVDDDVATGGFFSLDNFDFQDTTELGASKYNVELLGTLNVTLENGVLSSGGRGEIYATEKVRLTLSNIELWPQHQYTYGLYLQNGFSDIDGLLFNSSRISNSFSRNAVFMSKTNLPVLEHFSMRNSIIDIVQNQYSYGMYLRSYASPLSRIELVANIISVKQSFSSSSALYMDFFSRIGNGGHVIMAGNRFGKGHLSSSVDLRGGALYVRSHTVSLYNNSWEDINCSRAHCLSLLAENLVMENNLLSGMNVQKPYSILSVHSPSMNVTLNQFLRCSGYKAFGIFSTPAMINFSENILENSSSLEFYVSTSADYEDVIGGTQFIGPNFWGTASFETLRSKTYDSLSDVSLASISFPGLYLDRNFQNFIAVPPARSILNMETKMISGTIFEGVTVIVPAGLYYAPRPIIIQHPDAVLIFEGSVRVMFAAKAAISVRKGEFRVLGTTDNQVELVSTDQLAEEFGDSSIEHFSEWGGIWYGPDSKATEAVGGIYVDGSLLRYCHIQNAGYTGFEGAVWMEDVSIMMDHLFIAGSGRDGVHVRDARTPLHLHDVDIIGSARSGLYSHGHESLLELRNMNVTGSVEYSVDLRHHSDVRISGSNFEGGQRGISSIGGQGMIDISSSVIKKTTTYGLYKTRGAYPGLKLLVSGVDFLESTRALYVTSSRYEAESTTVTLSNFEACFCRGCLVIDILTYWNVEFEGNRIEDNVANTIFRLNAPSSYSPKIAVNGNIFRGNQATTASLGANAALTMHSNGPSSWNVKGNEFGNPRCLFEMSCVGFGGSDPEDMVVNATNNLFSFGANLTETEIDNRIYDDDEDVTKPVVSFVPFLSADYVPECKPPCLNQGACVFPGYCICAADWTGAACDSPTCQGLDYCSGNGDCIDLDVCDCYADWLGADCSAANCSAVRDCSGNGFCSVPNVCTCFQGYTGETCDECIADFQRIDERCVQCPICYNHGSCSVCGDTTCCECVGSFTGEECRDCIEGHFGLSCLPLPFIESVTPNDAFDTGGTPIRIEGINLGSSNATVKCIFSASGSNVDAEIIGLGVLRCVSPSVSVTSSGVLRSSLRVVVDGTSSYNSIPFTFYGLCPDGQCENGFCNFGRCQCYYGFGGDTCDEVLEPPKVAAPPDMLEIQEGSPFQFQLVLEEGTTPIDWAIVGSKAPQGMSLDSSTGLLIWSTPAASNKIISVRIRAQNAFSGTEVEVFFHVEPSYLVQVSTNTESRRRPSSSLLFHFETLDTNSLQPVGTKLAILWVRHEDEDDSARRKLLIKTTSDGTFSRVYQPYGSDVGRFVYGGEHPDYENVTEQGEFWIRGINVLPSSYYFKGFPGENVTLSDVFSFEFLGGSFSDLSIEVEGKDSVSDSGVSLGVELSASSAIEMNTFVTLSVSLLVGNELDRQIRMRLKSSEGDYVQFSIFIDVRERAAKLQLSAITMDVEVARNGEVRYEDVLLKNVGSRQSSPIEVLLPDQPILRSVGGELIPPIDVDEAEVISFGFTATPDMALGDVFRGSLILKENRSSVALDYKATIVSTVFASLTVITENEATYFAEDSPNLSDVTVRVRSLTTGASYTLSSGENGTASFSNLVEDVYEVYAQKLKHKPFRATIFLNAPGQTVLAFLQAEVVSYLFTVVPVEIVDTVIIEIEATFETFVPKPTVVWDPAYLDWEAIRSGLVNEIQLTGTNYGLVAAENVTLSWGRFWDNFEFIIPNQQQVGPNELFVDIGILPANSSITIPISIKPLLSFDVPDDRLIRRVGNNVVFYPLPDDPSWETGPSLILIPEEDPTMGQKYAKFNADGSMDFVFDYATSELHTIVYNGTEPVGVMVTPNATIPEGERWLRKDPKPVPVIPQARDIANSNQHRRTARFCLNTDDLICNICVVLRLPVFGPVVSTTCTVISVVCTAKKISQYIWAAVAAICYVCFGPICNSHTFPPPGDILPSPPCNPTDISTRPPDNNNNNNNRGDPTSEFRSIYRGVGGPCRELFSGRRLLGHQLDPFPILNPKMLSECPSCSEEALKLVYDQVQDRELSLLATESRLQECAVNALSFSGIKSIFSCVILCAAALPASTAVMPLVSQVVSCSLDGIPCYSDLSNLPGQRNLLIQAGRFQSFADLLLLPFGGELFEDQLVLVNKNFSTSLEMIEDFGEALVNGVSDNSEGGASISSLEMDVLLGVGLEVPSEIDIRTFIETWNRSLLLWENGIVAQDDLPANYTGGFFDLTAANRLSSLFTDDRLAVKREGFNSFGNAWSTALEGQKYEEARALAGVCAKVRVRIEQELTLTRIGFEARLEISNDGTLPLEDVLVSLRVNPFDNFTSDATPLFVFGTPDLNQVTSVDGEGVIAAESDALITWLIIPLTEAAPQFDTRYDVSGVLTYTIDDVEYIQNLAPDTITVRPDPQLYLTYFHSRAVYADDPFTPGIVEPAVPYYLGLLIENRGYGDAFNVKIASSQPEIVENEKGLLVDFSIIGSRLGNEPTSHSLNIDFGSIPSQSNQIAAWEMISALRGNFFNFSATFTYEGPIDDERLSLIESVSIFELTHLVRITGSHPAIVAMANTSLGYVDDDLDDFLVNKNPDAFFLPDTVFTSDSRESSFPVSHVLDLGRTEAPVRNADGSITVLVNFMLSPEELSMLHDWVYIRIDDPVARTNYILQRAIRTDYDYTLIPQANSWQTSWTDYLQDGTVDKQDFVSLFDFGVASTYRLEYALQQPVTNLRVTESSASSLSLAWDAAAGATASYVTIKHEKLGDQYYNVVNGFLQINSITIDNLAAGSNYTIKVYTGDKGFFEKRGAAVVGSTTGAATCGDSNLDAGEECDDGMSNGMPTSNCTLFCVKELAIPTRTDPSPTAASPTTMHPTTSSPTTGSPTTESPTTCFSGSVLVKVLNRGLVPMKQIQIGDMVQVGTDEYEPVYSFGHYDPERTSDFLRLETSAFTSLEVSSRHLVFSKSHGGIFVPASYLDVGDTLKCNLQRDDQADDNEGTEREVVILSITRIQSKGVYAPFTPSGQIIVNDVVASSFVAFRDDPYIRRIGGITSFSYQWLAHTIEFPHRLICHHLLAVGGGCHNETYDEWGMPTSWVSPLLKFIAWLDHHGGDPLKHLVLLVVLPLLVLFSLLEDILILLLKNGLVLLWLVLLGFVIMLVMLAGGKGVLCLTVNFSPKQCSPLG